MECVRTFSINHLALLILLLSLHLAVGSGRSNFTRETCLSIERTNSIRRSTKIVSVAENSPAYLHCSIDGGSADSDNLVAWTRLTDDALLTAGGRSFTTDARFQISPKRQARDWVLIIRRVQLSDEGCYLCEINTEPLTTLIPVYVEVIAKNQSPQRLSSTHKRNSNLSTKMIAGNVLLLNCSVEEWRPDVSSSKESTVSEVMWTRDNNPIDLSDDTKYFTEMVLDRTNKGFIYVLRIADASSFDNGLYACEGEGLTKSAQMVHVNKGSGHSINFSFYSLCFFSCWITWLIQLHRRT